MSVLQESFVDDAFIAGTTLATPSTGTGSFGAACTVGSGLEVWVTCSNTATVPTLTDSAGQTYVHQGVAFNAGLGDQAVHLFTLDSNASATKLVHTITYGSALDGKGIFVKEIAGPVAFNNSILNIQNAPGAGANAVTSTTITPTVVNTFLSAISMEVLVGNGSNLAAGTNYALNAAVFWKFGGATVLAKAEERTSLLGTLTATAATFTDATLGPTSIYITGLVMWAPAGASGSGALTEGHDTVAAAGSTSTTGSAAIVEPANTVTAAGSTSTSGSGAPTEIHDTVAGAGAAGSSATGAAAITEPADTAAGSGSTKATGSGASTETHDVVAGSGSATASGSGATTEGHDTAAGVGLTPASLATWRSVLAAVKAGSRRARLLTIGDSLTAGENSTGAAMGANAHSLSYPVQMAPRFLAAPAHQDSWFSNNNALSDFDTLDQYDFRITLGTGWIADTSNPTLAGYPLIGPASSAVLAFTPANSFDNFTIWFETFPGSPQYTVNIGGASLGTLPMNAAAGIGVANFSVSAGTHTINIVSNGTAGGKIFGCEAWLSTLPQIQVFAAGGDSWTAGDWTQNNGNAWDPLAMAEFLAPDLTLVCLAKNEQAQGISQATFEANLRTLVLGLLNTGSAVVIWGPPLSLPAGLPTDMSEAAQLAYETNMANVAANLGCTFYSLTQSRANWGSFAAANAAGFMFTGDNIHLTPAGYLDVANALLTVIDSGVATISEGHDSVSGAGAASEVGSAAIVQPADTVSGSGATGTTGSGASHEGADVVTANGSTSTSGAGAATESPDVVNASGSTSTTGSGAATEAHDVVSGSGNVGGSGSGAILEPADAVAASGSTSTGGSASIAEAPDTVTGAGSASTSGSASISEPVDAVSGAGTGTTGATGAAAIAEPSDAVAASGVTSTTGTGAVSETPDTVAGVGAGGGAGSGTATESHDSVSGSGSTSTSGVAAIAETPDQTGAIGSASTTGSGAASEATDIAAGAGTGTTGHVGSGAIVEPSDTAVGSGGTSTSGAAAVAEVSDAVSASGQTSTSGAGSAAETHDVAAGAGTAGAVGAAAISEVSDSVVAVGSAAAPGGLAAINEPSDSAAGSGSASTTGSGASAESPDIVSGLAGAGGGGSGAIVEQPDSISAVGIFPLPTGRTVVATVFSRTVGRMVAANARSRSVASLGR